MNIQHATDSEIDRYILKLPHAFSSHHVSQTYDDSIHVGDDVSNSGNDFFNKNYLQKEKG